MTQDDSTRTASSALHRLSNVSATTRKYNDCGTIFSHSSIHTVFKESIECNTSLGETLELPPPNENARVEYMTNCREATIINSTFIAADRNIVKRGGGKVVAMKATERGSTPRTESFGRRIKDSILPWKVDPQAGMYQTPDGLPPAVNPEEPEPHPEAQEQSTEGESGDVSVPPSVVQTGPESDSLGKSAGSFSKQSGRVRPSPFSWAKQALGEGKSMHVDPETGNRFFVSKGPVSITYDLPASSAPDFILRMQSEGDSRNLGAAMTRLGQDLSKTDWRHVMQTGRN